MLLTVTISTVAAAQPQTHPWLRAEGALAGYLKAPFSYRAEKVVSILASDSFAESRNDSAYGRFFLFVEKYWGWLAPSVRRGDPNALLITFYLHEIFDASLGEEIGISLGQAITKSPTAFLTQLRKSGRSPSVHFLRNLGDSFVDEDSLSAIEYGKRIKALQSVTKPELFELRDSCITLLSKGAG